MTEFNLALPEVEPTFPLGKIVMRTDALLKLHLGDMSDGLTRHAQGDWGDMSSQGKKENDACISAGMRLHSVYHDRKGVKFWIITEGNRKATTVLLPDINILKQSLWP